MIDRARAWDALARERFDVVTIGGGVTGAAIAYEAARRGLRVALLERGDFASGTSSRSSKLVHGGLRYLREGKVALTRESVHEREELLRAAPGLVEPMPFLMAHYRGRKPSRALLAAGLAAYDALAGWRHRHRYLGAREALALVPQIDARGLSGAHCYLDATTDDARLVLRLIHEACDAGAVALNYAEATPRFDGGRVAGIEVRERDGDGAAFVRAAATIAATGVFADELRAAAGRPARLRPLRGSHVVIESARLPLACAVAFSHPHDGRPVFAYPWLGCTLAGTTDLDHDAPLRDEPSIDDAERAYLLDALAYAFPHAGVTRADVIATYAGVRPIVGNAPGEAPSKASRDHAVWEESGLITITGGKLTTFRPMALDALAKAAPALAAFDRRLLPLFPGAPREVDAPSLDAGQRRRLCGAYGSSAQAVVACAKPGELERVGATDVLWAELRWNARAGGVMHLDDLLLRRTRLGLLCDRGGARYLERIGAICREELGWSGERLDGELDAYARRWSARYAP